MKTTFVLLALFSCSILAAQNLVGRCPNIKSNSLYLRNQSNETTDSVEIVNERFVFTSKLREPSLFTLRSNAFKGEIYLVLDRNKSLSVEIDSVGKVKYRSNNPLNVDFQRIHKEFLSFQYEIIRLSPEVDSLDNDSLMGIRRKIYDQYIQVITDFLTQKSTNLASALVLFEIIHLNNLLPPYELKKCFELLSGTVKNSAYGQKIGEYLKKELSLRAGNRAPEFQFIDLENKTHTLADYKGRYILLHFWASWCGPCRGENKKLPALIPGLNSLPVTIIHISQDSDKNAWLKAIKADKLENFIHVFNTKGEKSDVFRNYQISGIPDTVLIGPDGVIKQNDVRWEELEKLVK
jgi:peroxiredoxin